MIHICYSGNAKVYSMIMLSVLSVINNTEEPVTVRLFTMDLTEKNPAFRPFSEGQRALLEQVMRARNEDSRCLIVRADEAYLEAFGGGKNEKNYYTPYAFLRLLFDKFELPDRVLYLDVDVMCLKDLKELWETDLSAYELAAVRDHMGVHFYGRDYFNTGVVLFNLEKSKETEYLKRACEMVKTKRLMFPDQHALNRCAKQKLLLPRKFNEQRGIQEDTVLKHFCRGIKWLPFFKVYNVKQTDRERVHKFLKITEFDDIYKQFDEIAAANALE